MVIKALVIVYKFYLSFKLPKLSLTSMKVRNNISKNIAIQISIDKTVYLKNWKFLSLSFIKKSNYHTQRLNIDIVTLFNINVAFLNVVIKFYCKTSIYCLNLAIKITEDFNYMLVKLDRIIDTKNLLKLGGKMI